MTFLEYQQKASSLALYLDGIKEKHPDLPSDVRQILGLSYASLGLGESGEVQGKVKKIIRDCAGTITYEKKQEIVAELGDILWYISAMCTELGVNMDTVAEKNIDKLFDRRDRGVLKGSGDNR